ncbi:ester cyclase [Phenylobacterium montanum]|uniref:Ester cyclase n=1 Tax=Phenylobacterium montanum TaxID=2823693 RepID=A0A975IX58_9CAUL|nr:ester cyclase [Caulobacter sp. S6]QUD90284.1 ester cyclase [Caulobacter sp. S6]
MQSTNEERNQTTIRRLIEEVINQGRLDLCDQYLAADRIDHETYGLPEGMSNGHDGFKRVLGVFIEAFPDLHLSIKFMISDGERLAVYLKTSGTHLGPFMGAPATGKRFEASGVDIFAFNAEGLVSQHWGAFDTLGVMLQLGLFPGPTAVAA